MSRDKSLSVLTGQDVRRLSEFEADKAFAGCTDDSCASEIADALGAELVVFSTLGMLGETYDFNMNLIDTKTAMSLARVNRATSDTNQLRDVVTEAAKELLSRYHANQRRPESEKLQSETLRDVSAAANATTASTDRWPRWASVAWVAGDSRLPRPRSSPVLPPTRFRRHRKMASMTWSILLAPRSCWAGLRSG